MHNQQRILALSSVKLQTPNRKKPQQCSARPTKNWGKNVWCPPLPLGPAGEENHRRHALAEQLGLLVHVHHGELEHGAGCAAPHPEEEPGAVAVLELGAAAVGPRPQPEADVRLLGSRGTGLRTRRYLCIILRGYCEQSALGIRSRRIRMFFWAGPGSIRQRYGSGSGYGSFPFLRNVLSGQKCLQNKILTQNFRKKIYF
jgi:hypothetical protein